MVDKNIINNNKPMVIGRIRSNKFNTFSNYVNAVFKKMKLNPELINSLDLESEYYLHYYQHMKRIAFIWTLQSIFGLVIESILLMDRLLYLQENEIVKNASLFKIFDHQNSPRCFILKASKK